MTLVSARHAEEREEIIDLNKSSPDIEAHWTIIHRPHCKNVVIGNIYRPPKGDLEVALKYMDKCLKGFNLSKLEVFIIGDMNVNYKNKASADYKKVNFFAQSNGLIQVITNTTRNTDKTNSLLDLIMTNSKYISDSGTLNHYISDHQPVFVIKKKGRDNRPKVEFKGRSYRNFDLPVFQEKLIDYDWEEFYRATDPNEAWDCLLTRLMLILDEMCPVRTFLIKNYRPAWITAELIEQIKDRDYFYKKAKSSGEEDDWNIAKFLRNKTNANIRQAKRDFVLEELDNCQANCKKFWKVIKSVVPNNKGDAKQAIMLKDDGVKVGNKEVAHFVNSYFINVGYVPPEELQGNRKGDVCFSNLKLSEQGGWSPPSFLECELLKVVRDINVSKSSGLHNVSSHAIKEAFRALLPQVTFMMNLSLKTSSFPGAWKEALVIPIPKGGNLTLVKNYRPISLLPLPGKILEKLMHKHLTNYLDEESILTDNQHGFRKGHSTIHSIAQLTTFVNKKADIGVPTLATFVDFRKAFDCVQHEILLRKLSALGMHCKVIEWFRSYLTGRSQRVLANNVRSSSQCITQGVPQGSVLGPLFYILYANDIVNTVKYCKLALYADDTVLYTASANPNVAESRMRKDILALTGWCKSNGIKMNTDKTKLMWFGSVKKVKELPAVNIRVEGCPILSVNSYKYLGVTLDGQLNYAKHVGKMVSVASLKLKQFRRMRSFLSTKAAMLVYKSMLLLLLEYGDVFLSSATAENRKRLQVLQNKGLRCALNKGIETSTDELHDEADLLRLTSRREPHLLNVMFDMSQCEDKMLAPRTEGAVTRSSKKRLMKVKCPKTEKYKKSFAYRGPKRWNALPFDFHAVLSKGEFKTKIESHIKHKAAQKAARDVTTM